MGSVGDGRSARHDTMGRHKEGGRRPSEGGSPSTVVAMTTQARRRKCGQEKCENELQPSYNVTALQQRQRDSHRCLRTHSLLPLHS